MFICPQQNFRSTKCNFKFGSNSRRNFKFGLNPPKYLLSIQLSIHVQVYLLFLVLWTLGDVVTSTLYGRMHLLDRR